MTQLGWIPGRYAIASLAWTMACTADGEGSTATDDADTTSVSAGPATAATDASASAADDPGVTTGASAATGADATSQGDPTAAEPGAPQWSDLLPATLTFSHGVPGSRDLADYVVDPDGDAIEFSLVGAWPAGFSIGADDGELAYDGSGDALEIEGLTVRATDATGLSADSPALRLVVTDAMASAPTVTYDMATENRDGHDGNIAWQSVFLLEDGRIASFGTGNHAPNQANSVRILDAVAEPGSLSYDEAFPWTQDVEPPFWQGEGDGQHGNNLYVSNYDNHASIYLPPTNTLVWATHGVFDVASSMWTHGDRPPTTQTWEDYVDVTETPDYGNYNPAVAWCPSIATGVWFGASNGSVGVPDAMVRIVEADGAKPWRTEFVPMADQGVAPLWAARNTAVCIGGELFLEGPEYDADNNHFFRIDVAAGTLLAELTPPARSPTDNYPQMVYDANHDRLVFIGHTVQVYILDEDLWLDVTPPDWRGYTHVAGVYHPVVDAIFFRGRPDDTEVIAEGFQWHRMVFAD